MEPSSEVTTELRLPESPRLPMEFLSRSWSASSQQLSKALASSKSPSTELLIRTDSDDSKINSSNAASDSSSFASSNASHLVLQRIMSYTEISPMTSARPSHSGPLLSPNSSSVDLENDVVKVFKESGCHQREINPVARGGTVTVGRWLKDRREKKKEESRVNNAELHASVSVAGVAAAVAAMAAGNVGIVKDDERKGKLDLAVASAATLVAAHCVEVAEALGVERDQLASVVGSAVNVKCSDDVLTLTAAAATALRGAATLKARVMKDTQSQNAAFIHRSRASEKQDDHSNLPVDNVGSEELARGVCLNSTSVLEYIGTGRELLKRTRNGDLHRTNVSVYIHRSGEVMLKMTSKYVGGTITNKKKNVVIEVCKNMPPWPERRHLLEDGERRRYFGLKTAVRGIVEFECRDQGEHDLWTEGVSKLLAIVASR